MGSKKKKTSLFFFSFTVTGLAGLKKKRTCPFFSSPLLYRDNMNQETTNMDLQPMDSQATVVVNSPPSTPTEKSSQVDKEKEMAELLMTMDNYKAIVLPL